MPQIPFTWVNAFTEKPYGGNPATVVLLDQEKDTAWMQKLALEFGLSETAFLVRRPIHEGSKDPEYDLRWFTPEVEVDLCGHATLASAATLFTAQASDVLASWHQPGDFLKFHTRSGILTARRSGEKIELDFPNNPPSARPDANWSQLSEALGGVEIVWAGNADLKLTLVELHSEEAVLSLVPDFMKLRALSSTPLVIVTAKASEGSEFDFVSRFFAPLFGIDEDPVTGSAHAVLAPYWTEKLKKRSLRALQASKRRGQLDVEVNSSTGRVFIRGQASVLMSGHLLSAIADSS